MAVLVLHSLVLCVLVNFTREELLNIRLSAGQKFSLVFIEPESFSELLVRSAAALYRICLRCRRGRQAGALFKQRRQGLRTALPSIYPVNVRSVANKMDELLLLNRTNMDFCRFAALWSETWLGEHIPDSSLHLPGFQLLHGDCTELLGKTRGGGICFYINKGWCTDVTVLKKSCSPHLETLFINCKPFYSQWEFSSFILVGVYIDPQACLSEALQHLTDQITNVEQNHPDSLLIVLGDFNRAKLSHELPKYRQHIKCPTRDANILDTNHCYTVIKDSSVKVLKFADTERSSASSRTVTSLHTDRRLNSWHSGVVRTTWSWTHSKLWRWISGGAPQHCPTLHSEQHCLLWSPSGFWYPQSPRI